MENEVESLKKEVEKWKNELTKVVAEFGEFETGSKQYEAELEKQLEGLEQKNKELSAALERTAEERDALRDRTESIADEGQKTIARLETELKADRSEKDELTKKIRKLEQANDDLERDRRNGVCSLDNFEKEVNEMIEKNALLETGLIEKDSHIQRLIDETRDLRSELAEHERLKTSTRISSVLDADHSALSRLTSVSATIGEKYIEQLRTQSSESFITPPTTNVSHESPVGQDCEQRQSTVCDTFQSVDTTNNNDSSKSGALKSPGGPSALNSDISPSTIVPIACESEAPSTVCDPQNHLSNASDPETLSTDSDSQTHLAIDCDSETTGSSSSLATAMEICNKLLQMSRAMEARFAAAKYLPSNDSSVPSLSDLQLVFDFLCFQCIFLSALRIIAVISVQTAL